MIERRDWGEPGGHGHNGTDTAEPAARSPIAVGRCCEALSCGIPPSGAGAAHSSERTNFTSRHPCNERTNRQQDASQEGYTGTSRILYDRLLPTSGYSHEADVIGAPERSAMTAVIAYAQASCQQVGHGMSKMHHL
jgi:hypothetical protein